MSSDQSSKALSPSARRRLGELHGALLRLHKVLLDAERAAYERDHGRVTAAKMLDLAINDQQFAWLRRISELIVRIDEITDSEVPTAAEDAKQALAYARSLLAPNQSGNAFEKKYDDVLQLEPDAVLVHRQVIAILSDEESARS
jgi:hypothetical protein